MRNSIIQKLKNEGVLQIYHDYRSGDANDRSGNGNNGTLSATGATFTQKGLQIEGAGYVTVAHSAAVSPQTGTVVVFGAMNRKYTSARIVAKYVGAGDRFLAWAAYTADNTMQMIDSAGVTKTITSGTWNNKKYMGLNYTSGAIPTLYYDGVYVGSFSATVDMTGATAGAWYIGNSAATTLPINSTYEAFLLISRVLTATEHSQLFFELQNMKWPTKPYAKANNNLVPASNEPNLIGSWDMGELINNTVNDRTLNGRNLTGWNNNLTTENTLIGKMIKSDTSTTSMTLAAQLSLGTACTVEAVINPTLAQTGFVVADGLGSLYFAAVASTGLLCTYNAGYKAGSIALKANQFAHVMWVFNGTGCKFYVNGDEDPTSTNQAVGTYSMRDVLSFYQNQNNFPGLTKYVKVYNTNLSAAQCKQKYEASGVKKVGTIMSLEGAPISVAARGGAIGQFLENTPFQFGDATARYSISTDTVFGKKNTKVISCSTAGFLYMPSTQAYGEWRFDLYKALDANATNAALLSSSRSSVVTGSQTFQFDTVEEARIQQDAAEVTFCSPTSYVAVATWYRIKITRSATGVFTLWIKGGAYTGWTLMAPSGVYTNPFTDAVNTTSAYFVLDFDAGDMIANILFKPLA